MHLMAQISNDSGVTWQNYTEPVGASASGSPQIPPLVPSETFNPFLAFVEGYDLMYGVKSYYAVERGRSGLESVIHFLETGPGKEGNLSMNSASMSIRFPYPPQSGGIIGFLNDASSPITKMKDNTLVFPVQFLTLGGDAASTIMYQSSGQQPWILGKSATHAGCTNPSILEWESGKIIMITSCKYGRREVYESTDKGNTWKEALGTLSRVWSNSLRGPWHQIQSGFITATI
ncbi:trans-sialidase, putative, partial [Trypanosoma cruzi marinkellei]